MLGLSLSVNVSQSCKVCRQTIDGDQAMEDATHFKLFGSVPYAQCPCCLREVQEHRNPNYRARVRRYLLRLVK